MVGQLAIWGGDGIPVCQEVGLDACFHQVDNVWDSSNALWLPGVGVKLNGVGGILVFWVGEVYVLEDLLIISEVFPLLGGEGGLWWANLGEFDVGLPFVNGFLFWGVGENVFVELHACFWVSESVVDGIPEEALLGGDHGWGGLLVISCWWLLGLGGGEEVAALLEKVGG